MKITSVNIPAEKAVDGLEEIQMSKLGSIVLLAGKNGSGKSRILNKIILNISSKPGKSSLEKALDSVDTIPEYIESVKKTIEDLEKTISYSTDDNMIHRATRELRGSQTNLVNFQNALELYRSQVAWNFISTDNASENYQCMHFVPKSVSLQDPSILSKRNLINSSDLVSNIGIQHLTAGSFAKIQVIQDRYFETSHHLSEVENEVKVRAKLDYEELQKLIMIFLNTKITRSADSIAQLFGLDLGLCKLSNGQTILIQYCMAIYSQKESLDDLVLFLDEPENHLHPSAIIDVIERLQQCVPNGQIWIATHSVPLLSHYDPQSIWYVEENKIQHAGKITEKVLESLLGDESQIGKLQDFLGLPAQLATNRFAFECLTNPEVVFTNANDPQSAQIHEALISKLANQNLRVLEFGAGKGRILSNIVDLDEKNKGDLISRLDYIAFDAYDTYKDTCQASISRAYENPEHRYYNEMNSLLSKYNEESFDIVIMCNVLHEIEASDWINLFKPGGQISKLLKEDGQLLLVEDQNLPVGEQAYQKGFMVLDTNQVKQLFDIKEREPGFTISDARNDGRLKAHLIPKECLERITPASRKRAIESISNLAKEKILAIRNADKNYKNGKLHGFWVQQLANAQLILSTL